MAQTKRKRRTKHRGNAAGSIEARGRTGRKPTDSERNKPSLRESRQDRRNAEPTWGAAAFRAVFASVMLFALILYTPLAFATDKFVYARAQKRRAKS